jgi:hypothetical protein
MRSVVRLPGGAGGAGLPALFLTKFGKGIGPRGIENIVAKYCEEAGITGASVHTLRQQRVQVCEAHRLRFRAGSHRPEHPRLPFRQIVIDLAPECVGFRVAL